MRRIQSFFVGCPYVQAIHMLHLRWYLAPSFGRKFENFLTITSLVEAGGHPYVACGNGMKQSARAGIPKRYPIQPEKQTSASVVYTNRVTLLLSIMDAGSSSLVSGWPVTMMLDDFRAPAAFRCFEEAPKRLSMLTC